MALVSVIITVYNEKAYLRQCLDSLRLQTLGDFEAVCVDDASTDGSDEILREYAANDRRFHIVSNEQNIGLTKSRSRALQHVSGRYVMLLDADDFLSADAIEQAILALENHKADIALFDLQLYYGKNSCETYVKEPLPNVMGGVQAFKLCMAGKLHSVYLAPREAYIRIPFDDYCRLYSDDNTARLHLLTARTVCRSKGVYYYRRHEGSETHKVNINRFDYLIANMRLAHAIKEMKAGKDVAVVVEVHRWKNIVAHYRLLKKHGNEFSEADKRKIYEILSACIKSIDFSLLPLRLKMRPPYWPAWNLPAFIASQEIYELLRKAKKTLVHCLT